MGALVGGLGGALVGVIVGSSTRRTTWTPVHSAQMRITLAPNGTGLGIGVAF